MTPFFTTFFGYFKTTPAWAAMRATTEGTGWHREANVAVHTQMTIDHYVKAFAPLRTERQQNLSLLALLFHDISKPAAQIQTEKDGVIRNQYIGHELMAARTMAELFVDDVNMWTMASDAGMTGNDLAAICFVIEKHLPFGLKKKAKVETLKNNLNSLLGEDIEVFYDVLYSDAVGRISDNHQEKLDAVHTWVTEFRAA